MAGGTLGYSGALKILDDVAANGALTQTEFNDLQTIAANLENGIVTSSYVASIVTELVDGSPANASWTGGATASVTLGNLAAGATVTQMNELIGKWFLGTDLPIATGEGATASQTIQPSYQSFNQPLFTQAGTPTVNDVNQGDTGDCELCAGMIETLLNHPNQIQSMFVSDGNGVYGVRFYVGGTSLWVTVNDQLPVYQGSVVYNEGNGLWASLLEKAYAQLSSTGLIDQSPINSYSNISGDYAFEVLQNLTNTPFVEYLYSLDKNWNGFKNTVIDALNAKDDVIVESNGATFDSAGNQMLIANHAFAVVGYDSATGDFILRNPWGTNGGGAQSWDTQFEVSMADIKSVSGDFVIDNSANPNVTLLTLGLITSAGQSDSFGEFIATGQYVPAGGAIPIADLITAIDLAGLPISEYNIQAIGDGSIRLNGATNLANAAQQAQGEVVVSSADLAKLSFAAGSQTGATDLLVSGYDGVSWSIGFDVSLTVTAMPCAVIPSLTALVAPSASLPIANLFTLDGAGAHSGLTYLFTIENNVGTIALNGATNLLANSAGQVEIAAASLSDLTYIAPSVSPASNAGEVFLDVSVYSNGQAISDSTQIPIVIGNKLASAVQSFNQGAIAYPLGITDSAANVAANLSSLESMLTAGDLNGIALTDSGTPILSITAAQLSADSAVLDQISGNFTIAVAATTANLTLSGIVGHANIAVFGGSAGEYSLAANGSGLSVTDSGTGRSSVDQLSLFQALQFSDVTVIVSAPPASSGVTGGNITELYGAVFGREPDVGGLAYYQSYAAANSATPLIQYAEWFLSSPEYANNPAHSYAQTSAGEAQFIGDSYNNLLHRTPSAAETAYYVNQVIAPLLAGLTPGSAAYKAADAFAHAQTLVYFSQSPEFLGDVQVTATNPASASHWLFLT